MQTNSMVNLFQFLFSGDYFRFNKEKVNRTYLSMTFNFQDKKITRVSGTRVTVYFILWIVQKNIYFFL